MKNANKYAMYIQVCLYDRRLIKFRETNCSTPVEMKRQSNDNYLFDENANKSLVTQMAAHVLSAATHDTMYVCAAPPSSSFASPQRSPWQLSSSWVQRGSAWLQLS